MTNSIYLWVGFGLFVLAMMVLDLGVFHRQAHTVKMREAAVWTAVWVSLALVFNGVIYFWLGPVRAAEFLTGYVIEWTLSMDNVFVFAVIFAYFGVPPQYQHRVLFWGILGAVVLRLVFILAGAALLERFHWLIYPMGGFLVLTGVKLYFDRGQKSDVEKNLILRLARRWFRVTAEYEGHKFFVRRESVLIERTPQSDSIPTGRSLSPDPSFLIAGEEGRVTGPVRCSSTLKARWFVTPLFLVLVVVETTDVAFAADSIPAIFAVTRDPFIVFTSNIFAILGLRALYFLLAGTMDLFRYLSVGLAAILCFVGTKMLISGFYHIPVGVSLGVVCSMLAVAVGASLLVSKSESGRVMSRPHDRDEPAEVTEQQVAIKV